ncbi:DUF2341 domain-containing protein [Fulvivirga ulvae]|uniref:DUF2341 domain-containing protein n=1 Tax=Fulvivirga ulvae TaxID=2904245 RepID=UPI001F3A250F|nr:DUF2341 domain-containing protein [Fulvivirga ulvae]UII34567.1 DUF2341 domain-containing protein [Fulvivirga ulvae]
MKYNSGRLIVKLNGNHSRINASDQHSNLPKTGNFLYFTSSIAIAVDRMKYLFPVIVFLTFINFLQAQPVGYSYAKKITIQSSQVSGGADLVDFPVLISVTDNDLRETSSGGHVTNVNGYDIIFTTSDCGTLLDHQIERYVSTTGEYIAWVRIPTLSASSNTEIHMYYGNNSISGDPSLNSVWDSSYKGVWHFNNDVTDYTSNGSNLTDNSTTNLNAGKIGNARDLDNNTNILSSSTAGKYLLMSNGSFSGVTNFTFEGWVYLDRSNTNWERVFDFGQNTNVNFFLTLSNSTGSPANTNARITLTGNSGEQGAVVTNTTNTGSWIHWAVVLNNSASTMSIYRNGSLLGNATGVSLSPQDLEASTANYFGRSQYAADHYIDAKFDEFRISTTQRTAGWVATSYNNQNTPSSFYSIEPESVAESLCATLPVEFFDFSARPEGSSIKLHWITATEINNDYFTVERSVDGIVWQELALEKGAGTSHKLKEYTVYDTRPNPGESYYRIKQTDYDGSFTYSILQRVNLSLSNISIYYIQAQKELIIDLGITELYLTVSILSAIGEPVDIPIINTLSNRITYDASSLSKGMYVVRVVTPQGVKVQGLLIR